MLILLVKLGNVNFTGTEKEIYPNPTIHQTGCSKGLPSSSSSSYTCLYTYDDNIRYADGTSGKGVGASTTGTIYGIYDMNGGVWEYVMGNYNDMVGSSGFSEPLTLDSKYYNKYTSSTLSEACNGNICLSHALSETAGWYGSSSWMIEKNGPWLLRGGGANFQYTIFSYYRSNYYGGETGSPSFRLVLSPSE